MGRGAAAVPGKRTGLQHCTYHSNFVFTIMKVEIEARFLSLISRRSKHALLHTNTKFVLQVVEIMVPTECRIGFTNGYLSGRAINGTVDPR